MVDILQYDITIRAYCDPVFETVDDRIYKITCDRNKAIPATVEVDKEFKYANTIIIKIILIWACYAKTKVCNNAHT